ncbi:hypothetical protein GE061_006126 [Apolygus lucorum]|uniref:Lipase domain-containing protein n=1 Tax=Apolygus lucorum TaxID=248454 RepID=A0A6A4J476_APOLU|nr:hypothetical protein GE061_006126 [Apolygus lucorum]
MIRVFGIRRLWPLIFLFTSSHSFISIISRLLHISFCAPVNKLLPTEFHLRTKDHYNLSSATSHQKLRIFEKHLDPKKEVLVTIHEYLRGCDKPFTINATKAYLKTRPGIQVVNVCWSAGFPTLESHVGVPLSAQAYPTATRFVPCVGDVVAHFLRRIHSESAISWKNITLIGHSLGAQLSGDVGNKLGGRLKKIIALDPATPLYGISPLTSSLLKPKSAKRVIVVHTSLGQYNMGTADFYANVPYTKQPGCEKFYTNVVTAWTKYWLCNHTRSVKYFIQAILNKHAFPAKKCLTYRRAVKGKCRKKNSTYVEPDTKARGIFLFKTKSKYPYY